MTMEKAKEIMDKFIRNFRVDTLKAVWAMGHSGTGSEFIEKAITAHNVNANRMKAYHIIESALNYYDSRQKAEEIYDATNEAIDIACDSHFDNVHIHILWEY